MARKSFVQLYKLRLFGFLVLIAFGAWMGIARFSVPTSINQLTIAKQQTISPKMDCSGGDCRPTPPGCYYKQVQCVSAPCDPILVCTSPTPTASTAIPSSLPAPPCRQGIANLKLSKRCGASGFLSYDFRCESGKTAQINSETCLEAGTIYSTVRTTCINVCIGDKK